MPSTHPRRRAQNTTLETVQTCPSLPSIDPKQAMSLRKGSTFHSPKSPANLVTDPILDVRSVPLRSPTSPQALEDLVFASENRISALLENIDRSLAGQKTKGLNQTDSFPVPRFLVAHASIPPKDMDKKETKTRSKTNKYGHGFTSPSLNTQNNHSHASDSGLGSSVSSVTSQDRRSTAERLRLSEQTASALCFIDPFADLIKATSRSVRSRDSVYSPTRRAAGTESSASSSIFGDEKLFLSAHATKKIKEFIIEPILAEEKLKEYHRLVGGIPHRIGEREITCLRDLEKTLIFLAPSKAKSAASYLQFCETSIQCIHTTVDHLNDQDLRRPSDRPYTNNYFLDLVQQVRQYARIMAASKQKQAEGKSLGSEDYTTWVLSDVLRPITHVLTWLSEETIRLQGGMNEDGRPAELVRVKKDGEIIAIDTEKMELADDDDDFEDDPERSMARKRKCDIGKEVWRACRECGKQFKRPCDLTKHEKTHSRPWKCPVESCKYHMLGWPTEKECDRHVNDKHTSTPAMYHCLYEGCTYTSKRESNCKQHMEKTHGYDYVRSKSKKAARLMPTPIGETPDANMLTPSSAFQSISSPDSDFNSPRVAMMNNELSPPATDEGSPFSMRTGSMSLFDNNAELMGQGQNINGFGYDGMQMHPLTAQTSAGQSVSAGTPNTALTFSDIDPSLPEEAWNMQFDFGELANDNGFPSPEEFFNQYGINENVPAQQPTPAMSDFDLSKDMADPASKQMTLAAQHQNPMFNQQQDSLPSSAFVGGDFSLFGEQGESSNMASMFSDLNGNGGQFSGMNEPDFDLEADMNNNYNGNM